MSLRIGLILPRSGCLGNIGFHQNNVSIYVHLLFKLNDCIRNANAVCNPRQNSVRDKI